MTASLKVRSHEAIVIIRYDESNYQIDYYDSSNLNFSPNDLRILSRGRRVIKGPRIHKNYNVWVRDLAKTIQERAWSSPIQVGGT